jgi:hypothetical protein
MSEMRSQKASSDAMKATHAQPICPLIIAKNGIMRGMRKLHVTHA